MSIILLSSEHRVSAIALAINATLDVWIFEGHRLFLQGIHWFQAGFSVHLHVFFFNSNRNIILDEHLGQSISNPEVLKPIPLSLQSPTTLTITCCLWFYLHLTLYQYVILLSISPFSHIGTHSVPLREGIGPCHGWCYWLQSGHGVLLHLFLQ